MNGYGRVIYNDGTYFEGMFKNNLMLEDGKFSQEYFKEIKDLDQKY